MRTSVRLGPIVVGWGRLDTNYHGARVLRFGFNGVYSEGVRLRSCWRTYRILGKRGLRIYRYRADASCWHIDLMWRPKAPAWLSVKPWL